LDVSDLYWLTDEQMERLRPHFPKGHSRPGVDDRRMLGDRGYHADWSRDALQAKGITPFIPGRKSRIEHIQYDKRRYKLRKRIERIFARLTDWRRVASR
jgi:transposase